MPQIAQIVVKNKSDADVTFAAKVGAASDGSYAQWLTNGPTALTSSSFRVRTLSNKAGTARRVEASGAVPTSTLLASGEWSVLARQPFRFETTIPLNVASATNEENAYVIANLIASQLMKEMIASGYAAA